MASYHLPFDLLLSQGGHPLVQSLFKLLVLMTNVALAMLLVPGLGILGAALAYSLSLATYGFWLRELVGRKIGPVF